MFELSDHINSDLFRVFGPAPSRGIAWKNQDKKNIFVWESQRLIGENWQWIDLELQLNSLVRFHAYSVTSP